MAIEAAATTTLSANQSTLKSQVQKTTSESFKEELSKASDNDAKNSAEVEKSEKSLEPKKTEKKESESNVKSKEKASEAKKENQKVDFNDKISEKGPNVDNIKENALGNINANLTDNIYQMMSSNIHSQGFWSFSLGENSTPNALTINESDADFFINLTKNENVNVAAISSQAQNMIDQGADVNHVQKSAAVSETLLQALSNAREKNQPVRIDFDKNISVVLRVSQNGTIAAHFIPGDKAVEQYLRNNIESLKNTFNENDIPYSDLSYSHSSKEQNQRRRNERQGE